MEENKCDKTKFNFAEVFNNENGKTSGSAFIGIYLGLIAGMSFLGAMVAYFMKQPNVLEVMGKILTLVAFACALLGVRKYVEAKSITNMIADGDKDDDDKHEDHDGPDKH
jgi:hypothetical protein